MKKMKSIKSVILLLAVLAMVVLGCAGCAQNPSAERINKHVTVENNQSRDIQEGEGQSEEPHEAGEITLPEVELD